MNSKLIAVVGAGVMGSDLALDLALHDYRVILKDITDNALHQAKLNIRNRYRHMKLVKKTWQPSSLDHLLELIRFTTDYSGFEQASFVIENITENQDLKKGVYQELADCCDPDTVFGVNTSCISITLIGSFMPDPGKVVGTHFLNPVPLKSLVEVIQGYHTSQETLDRTKHLLKSLEKVGVVVNDYPGFVTNRVLMLTINECIWLVQDQVASAKDIDTIFKVGFSHKMGPLATADLIGLDTILNSLLVLTDSFKDSKFRPCPLLCKMVAAGTLGQKSGRGFFNYQFE